MPSDHAIKDVKTFENAVKTAVEEAKKGSLVTFGIEPTFAATGYGYIEGDSASISNGILQIKRFVEKPDLEKAKKYYESGNFFWNSGMFVFKADSFLEELKALNKEIFESTKESLEKARSDQDFIRLEKESFSKNPNISIDYAVMEKTAHGKVVPLNAGWSDVGSWSSLWETSEKDKDGNTLKGDVIAESAKDSFVYSKNRLVALLGLSDIVIVDTEDALLVADKKRSEEVKTIVDKLKALKSPLLSGSSVTNKTEENGRGK